MGKKGDYLYRRKGSNNWYLRIQIPAWLQRIEGRKKIERSLGTSDREEAELLAFDDIKYHKQSLFLRKQFKLKRIDGTPGPLMYEPGKLHRGNNGESIIADEDTIKVYSSEGNLIRTEKNPSTVKISLSPSLEDLRFIAPYLPKTVDPDDEIIRTWIAHRNIGKHLQSEAYNTWATFKAMVGSKRLAKCQRSDGRELASLMIASGNSTATVEKKIGHLRAAVNLAIDEGKLTSNPFIRVVPQLNDHLERRPLNNLDMSLIKSNLDRLSSHDQLLLLTLATTGMRLSEAFQITEEMIEDGIRFTIVGTKSKSSKRRIPFPSEILPLLPTTIIKQLFVGDPEVSGKRIRYYLKGLGISYDAKFETGDKRKVVHSLRHRAKDRLRANGCPLDIQYELLGHETRTVAAGYGHGSRIISLKRWIDTIGSC